MTGQRDELLAALWREGRQTGIRTVVFQHTVASTAGVSVTDFNCINVLVVEGPMTPSELAARTGLTRGGAITSAVDRLERAGYVRRLRGQSDRRKVIIEPLVEAIEARINPLFESYQRLFTEQLDKLSDDQVAVIATYHAAINEVLRGATEDLQARPR